MFSKSWNWPENLCWRAGSDQRCFFWKNSWSLLADSVDFVFLERKQRKIFELIGLSWHEDVDYAVDKLQNCLIVYLTVFLNWCELFAFFHQLINIHFLNLDLVVIALCNYNLIAQSDTFGWVDDPWRSQVSLSPFEFASIEFVAPDSGVVWHVSFRFPDLPKLFSLSLESLGEIGLKRIFHVKIFFADWGLWNQL